MKAVTHDGTFHADDIFSAAVLRRIFPDIKFTRTRDPKIIAKADITFDVGGIYDAKTRRFDHHQNSVSARRNGIMYSSFGLVWRNYGKQYCGSQKIANQVDEQLVQPVDADDNGQAISTPNNYNLQPFTICQAIADFNPKIFVNDKKGQDYKLFLRAIDFAEIVLDNLVLRLKNQAEVIAYLKRQIASTPDKRYVVLDRTLPLHGLKIPSKDLLYIVYPQTNDDNWAIRAVTKDDDEFMSRQPFPASWSGLVGEKLAQVSGAPNAVFCHKARFLVVAKTKNSAIELIHRSLNNT